MLAKIGIEINPESLPSMHKERVLEEFDGPLLVEFRTDSNEIYFCSWIDCDDQANRWAYFRVNEADVVQYDSDQTRLIDLLKRSPEQTIYLVDRGRQAEIIRAARLTVEEILSQKGYF